MTKMIDAERFAQAFESSLPDHAEAHVAALAAVGGPTPKVTTGTLCEMFPKIKAVITSIASIPFISWFVPGWNAIAPAILALLSAIEATLLPILCGTAPGGASLVGDEATSLASAKVKTNVKQGR